MLVKEICRQILAKHDIVNFSWTINACTKNNNNRWKEQFDKNIWHQVYCVCLLIKNLPKKKMIHTHTKEDEVSHITHFYVLLYIHTYIGTTWFCIFKNRNIYFEMCMIDAKSSICCGKDQLISWDVVEKMIACWFYTIIFLKLQN